MHSTNEKFHYNENKTQALHNLVLLFNFETQPLTI